MNRVGGFLRVQSGVVELLATPWAAPYLRRDELATIEITELLVRAGRRIAIFSADGPRGPFLATVGTVDGDGDVRGKGATCLSALRAALGVQ